MILQNKIFSCRKYRINSRFRQNILRGFIRFLVPVLIITACTEPMELELDSTFTRLVVEGSITTDTTTHRVKISKTTDFYDKGQPPAVSGAIVKISDGNNLVELSENPYGSGIYETPAGYYGTTGKTYTLLIELEEEIGGFTTYDASCLLRPTAEPDSIQVVYQPAWGDGFWEIKLYAQDPPTQDYYKFLTYINDVLVTDSLQEVFVTDDRFFNGNYTNGIGVGYLNALTEDNVLRPGDIVTLKMANLTEEYAHFIMTARIESGFNTPLFSGPPANVQSNVSNGAIGFFAAFQPRYVSREYDGK
jgi:hypothetical protein